jgi:hypothetical protein
MDTTVSLLQAAGKGRRMNSLEIFCIQLLQQQNEIMNEQTQKDNTSPPSLFNL